jgi:L-asparaginase
VESHELLNFDQPQELKSLSQKSAARLSDSDVAGVVFTHERHRRDGLFYELDRAQREAGCDRGRTPTRPLICLTPFALPPTLRLRGKGTLVVLNDEINAARDITESNAYRVETFVARELGILGCADADKIVFYRAPTHKHMAQLPIIWARKRPTTTVSPDQDE